MISNTLELLCRPLSDESEITAKKHRGARMARPFISLALRTTDGASELGLRMQSAPHDWPTQIIHQADPFLAHAQLRC